MSFDNIPIWEEQQPWWASFFNPTNNAQQGEARTVPDGMTAFPNPTRGEAVNIHYQVEQPGPVRLSLHDMNGREVAVIAEEMTEGIQKATVNVGQFPAGTYFYRLSTSQGQQTKQMIID